MHSKVDMILKIIGRDKVLELEDFVIDVMESPVLEFSSEEEIMNFFNDYLDDLFSNRSLEDISLIRYYTGISFKDINAILRDNWNYEYNGQMTKERKEECLEIAERLCKIISEATPLLSNIKTYRGVGLSSFKEYDISTLEDLLKLKGQYYFDDGFTSTSLIRGRSFFQRFLEYHEECNIEIEYLIPSGSIDAIPLITEDLSYSDVQMEYLLNKGNLSKIDDVFIDSKNNKAYIKMVLIPSRMWNTVFESDIDSSKVI